MSKQSIRLNIQKPAQAVEIYNANQLRQATGFTNKTAYALWAETITRIDFETLDTLCRVFKCGIETILIREGATRKNGSNKNRPQGPQTKARPVKRR